MKFVIPLILSLMLLGCGLEIESVDNEKFKQDQVNELKENFSVVQGFYEGELLTASGLYPIEIKVHIFESLGETGADGKPVPKVELIGRFRRTDIVQSLDYMNFNSEYNPSTSAFKMAYKSDNLDRGFGVAEDANIFGSFKNGRIEGYFSVSGGIVGQITATRKTKNVIGKSRLEEINEYHERLYQAYLPLIGVYEDCLRPTSGKEFPMKLEIEIGYQDKKPILVAAFNRLDLSTPLRLGVHITYDQLTQEVTIEPPKSEARGRPGAYIYANGQFENDTISLKNLQSRNGIIGNGLFKSRKNKKIKMGYCNKKSE